MAIEIHQGDILKVEKIMQPVLVLSKDFFNTSGEIIGCPIYQKSTLSPLHIPVSAEEMEGYVECEKLKLLDLKARGYMKVDRISVGDLINITDAVQSIFEYI